MQPPPDTARRPDTTRNGFPAIGTYKKSIGIYKRGSGTGFPEPRIQVRANFQEMRASGTGFPKARTGFRETRIPFPGYRQRKNLARTACRASARRSAEARL